MPSRNELIGFPIINRVSGKAIGRVSNLLLDARARKICALMVQTPSLLRRMRCLDYACVRTLGPSSVLVDAPKWVKPHKDWQCPDFERSYGNDGAFAGWITDVDVDPMGNVLTMEVSKGFFEDLRDGRSDLPVQRGSARNTNIKEEE